MNLASTLTDVSSIKDYLGLFTAIITIIGIFIGLIIWYYKKRPSVKANVVVKKDLLKLRLRNHKDSLAEIDHVRLVKKRAFWRVPEFNDNNYGYLVDSKNGNIFPFQSDELNIAISPNESVKEFKIYFSNIAGLYDDFLPYEYLSFQKVKSLSKPVKMPNCHIGIYLKSGRIVCVSLPEEFYSYYRRKEGSLFDTDYDILMGQGDITLTFNSMEANMEHLKRLRESYYVVRRNYHLLLW
ncbi:hypothetical protein ACRN97_02220 [Shewanella baltica]|uniref:hypothetical protein n=1 Tax=Shewanella baltica TaxID=62322 RepID=UPI003D7B14A5